VRSNSLDIGVPACCCKNLKLRVVKHGCRYGGGLSRLDFSRGELLREPISSHIRIFTARRRAREKQIFLISRRQEVVAVRT
jgi:hypothetical protein